MSTRAIHTDDARIFHAPDGIAIVPFDLPGLAHLSFVEGRIPPRPTPYPVHLHGALEQVTYVLVGRISVTTWDVERLAPTTFDAAPGDAFLTLPLQTLSFTNIGPDEARVLFVCAPAYPPDDSDTRLVTDHHAPAAAEIAWSYERQSAALAAFTAILEARK